MSYAEFLARKQRVWTGEGLHVLSTDIPAQLFDWQAAITRWALRKGRAAIFADCGLGKSFMQLSWARAIPGRVLIFAPLCVAEQTVEEGQKLGIRVQYARKPSDSDAQITITNYERLDDFDMDQYAGVVLDESSILKALDGVTKSKLIEAAKPVTYRLCCTATPSPNDIAELANHAEFLGFCTRAEFLATWFVHDDAGWRMKRHAVQPFYRWLASWALALRTPSDLGYTDGAFKLPPLQITDHVLPVEHYTGDTLFPEMGTKGLGGRLAARRASLTSRVETAARLAQSHPSCQWLVWCGLNEESEAIARAVPGSVQVSGSDSYAEKVGAVQAFTRGEIRVLVSKPKILGFGMNFQNAHHMAFVGLSDSYEAYYQCVRRSWRFGQQHPVHAHVIFSEAEKVVVENVRRKEAAARSLSTELIDHMRDFERQEIA